VSIVGTHGKRIGPSATLSLDFKICTLRAGHMKNPFITGVQTFYDLRTCGIHSYWERAPLVTEASTCNGAGNVTFWQVAGFCEVAEELVMTV
jgi:hypothetical protein